jgi:hypothetical protein
VRGLFIGVAWMLLVAAPAGASEVSLSDAQSVTVRALPGERNRVSAAVEGGFVRVVDRAGVTAGPGCTSVDAVTVVCAVLDAPVSVGAELGDGDDVLTTTLATTTTTADGGAGADELRTGGGVLRGGPGDDRLVGGTAAGGDGDDVLFGSAGFDRLDGGGGDDVIRGGDGDDELFGGGGRDRLAGEAGDDYLLAGSGDDVLDGGAGADRLLGGSGTDVLRARDDAADTLECGSRRLAGDRATVDAADVTLWCSHVARSGAPRLELHELQVVGRRALRLTVSCPRRAARDCTARGRITGPSGYRRALTMRVAPGERSRLPIAVPTTHRTRYVVRLEARRAVLRAVSPYRTV